MSTPLAEGSSTISQVSSDLAAKAQAEVEAARSAPRETANGEPVKRGRGRPPLSPEEKARRAALRGQAPSPSPSPAVPVAQEEKATPEEFEAFVDMANMIFAQSMIDPVPPAQAKEWSIQAAKVANRWGGSLPLLPELSLLGATAMIFGPRVLVMLDPDHKELVRATQAAKAAKLREEAHKATLAAQGG